MWLDDSVTHVVGTYRWCTAPEVWELNGVALSRTSEPRGDDSWERDAERRSSGKDLAPMSWVARTDARLPVDTSMYRAYTDPEVSWLFQPRRAVEATFAG